MAPCFSITSGTMSFIHKGEFMGTPAANKQATPTAMEFWRLQDCKFAFPEQ